MNFPHRAIEKHLACVDAAISAVFDCESALIRGVGAYLLESGGKKIRPAMTLLAARACGRPVDDTVIRVASAMEIFHVATLLHDDVIDQAATRRGRPSVNAKWSDGVAILMADFLFAKAFDLSMADDRTEILRILSAVTSRMCEGELFQIEKAGQLLSRDDYFKIIGYKTAHLFSACAAIGGTIADAAEDGKRRLRDFGMNFGMAFQITDDVLDYQATDERWGKALGSDVVHGKQTLPLIYTLEVASPQDRAELLGLLNNGRDLSLILPRIEKYRGLDHARAVADEFAGRATLSLEGWAAADGAVQALRDLCAYVVSRSY
ncbi:MAG: polyprenyl synthetase family protein [Candidatus Sumerlaeota bacterium]|nr:polyprenyl synthetase family protein [Candidatus Sumerlaeota bacterium]